MEPAMRKTPLHMTTTIIETSVAVAETHLLPAVRARGEAVVLADGVSCRVQLADLEDLRALHLAELLAFGAPADQSGGRRR